MIRALHTAGTGGAGERGTTRNRLEGAISGRLLAGTTATETGDGVIDNRRRLQQAAELLREDALRHEREAARIENTDSAMTDLTDFVGGRDLTPWS
jgi:hypothetical protein